MKLRIFHLFVIYAACAFAPFFSKTKVPVELIGVWETAHPGYEQALIEITPSAIIFKNGPEHTDDNKITGVQTKTKGGRTLYIIDYASVDGSRYSLPLYYTVAPSQSPELRLKNQDQIRWSKGY